MCGVMLKHHGYDVTVLEKETSSSRKGYDAGIGIGPEFEDFLKRHDRVKREISLICTPGGKVGVNGEFLQAQRGITMVMTSWGLMVSVLRANFDGLTSEAVPVAPCSGESDGKATFRLGARVTGVNHVDGNVDVHFVDAESGENNTLSADLVIVADGSTSRTRQDLLPDVKRKYLGYMCWRGTVREEQIDEKWNEMYAEKATFHLMNRTYLLK